MHRTIENGFAECGELSGCVGPRAPAQATPVGLAPPAHLAHVSHHAHPVMTEMKVEPGTSLMRPSAPSWDMKELLDKIEGGCSAPRSDDSPAAHHAHQHGAHRCPDCGKCFSKQDRLKRHQSMHSEDLKRFECSECKKSFKWERSLSQHVKIHSDNNPYVCSVCRKSFSKRCHLESHLRTHIDDHKRFTCIECGKSFKWEKSLNQHCKTHSHDMFYHCGDCGRSFRKQRSYSQHYKVHAADNPFTCVQCGKAFSKRSHYEGHLTIHDEDKKTYPCNQCEKKFKWEKSLTAHSLLHSGEIPYKCDICNKSFTRSDSLKKHLKTHKVKQEKERIKYIHALPFDYNTSEEQVKSYMQKIENTHFDVEKHTAKNNEFASFKIGVPSPYFEKFMQASVWPENMYIKEWQAYQWQPTTFGEQAGRFK